MWTSEATDAFELIKQIMIEPPILAPPDFNEPFTIQCDACDTGVGAVLTQTINGEEKVIAYYSSKLTKPQQNYSATEKECLAVITASERFRPYIDGTRFTVITDHASLLWLQSMKQPTHRLARWALRLQEYDFALIHRKGKHNVVPDALSRIHMKDHDKTANTTQAVDKNEWYAVTISDFKNLQDPVYIELIKNVANRNKNGKRADHYKYQNELLYYHRQLKYVKQWLIYVPADYTEQILKQSHDDILAGHGGFYKTLKRIQHNYFWPKVRDEVSKYCYECKVCQASKPSNQNNISPMGNFREP